MRTEHAGSCHCGRARFEVTAAITELRVCDCSVCRRRGALLFRVDDHALRVLTPLSDLATYVWGSGTGRDFFCSNCGILPFRRPSALTATERAKGVPEFTGWAVNARCLDDVDLDAVPRRMIHGSRL